MKQSGNKKFFSRSNLVIWGPLLLGVLSVEVLFGWKDGAVGILWNVAPIIIGLLYCVGFLLFGRFLSGRVQWPLKLIILAATSAISATIGLALLIVATSPEPHKEFSTFLPANTAFILVLLFSAFFTAAGFILRPPKK